MAGKSQVDAIREALAQRLTNYQVYETTGYELLAQIVQEALDQGFDLVVAAGGDGTVSGVASGLVHTSIPLGIIPFGTGNMLARDLGLPLELEAALDLLVDQHALKAVDAMQMNDRFYFLNIGLGISSLTMRETDAEQKRRLGLAAYVWTGLKQLLGFQPRRFVLDIDGENLRFRASEVLIANGRILGMPHWRRERIIRPDDGQLDVFVISARTILDYLRLAAGVLFRQGKGTPSVHYKRAAHTVSVDVDRPLPVQADGESVGQTPVQVRVVPGAVQVIVPVDDTRNGPA